MAWTEMEPGRAGVERVRVSRMRGGSVLVSMSAAVAKRNKLGTGTKVRVFVDLEGTPRQVRIVVDPAGGFKVRVTKGGGAVVVVGKLSGFEHVAFERTDCEFDECTDEKKRVAIDVELPKALQPQARPMAGASAVPARPPVQSARLPDGVRRA